MREAERQQREQQRQVRLRCVPVIGDRQSSASTLVPTGGDLEARARDGTCADVHERRAHAPSPPKGRATRALAVVPRVWRHWAVPL